MNVGEIQARLHREFGSSVGSVDQGRLEASIGIEPDAIDAVCAFLKDQPDLRFDSLGNLSGVDLPDANVIRVVYRLRSYELGHEVTLKVDALRSEPRVKTVEGVWPAANWLEREVYDLLGVLFEGHSDLRRILLPDDWVGHPLRKDYREQPSYHGISTVRESMLTITRN
jgi:NADH-quinone oxidoreductase subunit C